MAEMSLAIFLLAASYAGVFFVIFAQTAFLFGIVFPGSSFLLVAGFLASQGYFDISLLIVVGLLASVLGDSTGYLIGRRFGPKIFERKRSRFFSSARLEKTRAFYRKHGGKTVVFARFVHFARTLVPTMAGASKMHFVRFLFYSVMGSVLWTVGVPLLGYHFGVALPATYLRYVIGGLLVWLLLSFVLKTVRARRKTRLLYDPENPPLCLDLSKFDLDDRDLAGGKGAHLGELMKSGFPVPAGFMVTTHGYDRFVEENGLKGRERSAFLKGTIPDDVREEILRMYRQLGGGPVAVRSSATAEDLPEAAFAGQLDTSLHVVGEDALLDAVRKGWASLWSDRVKAYRKKKNIKKQGLKLAVVVQRMVPAKAAGVLFTANPVTGDSHEMMVDASTGLGEAVVSGMVTPDHIVLKRRFFGWRIVQKSLGKREVVITPREKGGTKKVHPQKNSSDYALPDKQLLELARIGDGIEQHFGSPQDVEWAWDGNNLFIVQSRPITALPEPLTFREKLWRQGTAIIGELFAIRPYPLDVTLWWREISRLINIMIRPMGLRFDSFSKMMNEEDGIFVQFQGRKSPVRPSLWTLLAPFHLLWLSLRYSPAKWKDDPLLDDVISQARAFEKKNLTRQSWGELLHMSQDALKATVSAVGMLRYRYLPPAGVALGLLFLQLKLVGRSEYFAKLLSGMETKTTEANKELEQIAQFVRSNAHLQELFKKHTAQELPGILRQDSSRQQKFLTMLDAFMDEYGHRETHFTGPSQPTWKDAPHIVYGMIQSFVLNEKPATIQEGQYEAARAELLTHRVLSAWPLRPLFLATLGRARYFLQIREDTHFYATLTLPIIRRILLECGERLLKEGVMNTAEDVFHLTMEELEKFTSAWPPSKKDVDALKRSIARRRKKREALKDVPLIDQKLYQHEAQENILVKGTPGSPGVAEGTVRVVHDPSEFHTMRAGDVLVAPYTNPAWTPLFQSAVAVVVDSGGVGSHAAIVAREYKIPAVMGTVDGTKRLKNGQKVRVHGDNGLVVEVN